MQDKPSATELLEAIQDFLMKEVLPEFKDKDLLAYKTLVSWNMLGVISREIRSGEESLDKELSRLSSLLGKKTDFPKTWNEKKNLTSAWNEELRDIIRKEKKSLEDTEYWKHIKESVIEKVEIVNPRFTTES
ncbi:DUF6285 domain-containing protein [Leptospira licerasiae]|uniref:DUF6285 domain-containing protein n=1 Tax=Leptospira licerasiae str. MMD4847 TaxID=1049971 RepID=A0ABN0H5N9_9LEPT|nr:DUF6285 domain-containing protein [Leptospira licerasiae]EIE00749.1 hypothetical protein LEP1GSC185_0496 [Leptospira licerasiae serovar Varillal str. VAR 010]EJZ40658.1 hypothetical protein LEP1GSC178_1643 [Leptospira licerasiae str. MMD4847]TGM88636.1 hypothetical protein EHR05_14290 [Leptospira licerasiae]